MMIHSMWEPTHAHMRTSRPSSSARWVPELVAECRDLPGHALTAVGQFLQLPLQLPLLGVGARVLLFHLLQLPLQLLQPHHGLVQLQGVGKKEWWEKSKRAEEWHIKQRLVGRVETRVRLFQADYFPQCFFRRKAHHLGWDLGINCSGWKTRSTLTANAQMPANQWGGLGLVWIELAVSLASAAAFKTATLKQSSRLADPNPSPKVTAAVSYLLSVLVSVSPLVFRLYHHLLQPLLRLTHQFVRERSFPVGDESYQCNVTMFWKIYYCFSSI